MKKEQFKIELLFLCLVAERQGFEPRVPLGTAVFKTAAIDHSATSPNTFEVTFFPKAMQRYNLFSILQMFWLILKENAPKKLIFVERLH